MRKLESKRFFYVFLEKCGCLGIQEQLEQLKKLSQLIKTH